MYVCICTNTNTPEEPAAPPAPPVEEGTAVVEIVFCGQAPLELPEGAFALSAADMACLSSSSSKSSSPTASSSYTTRHSAALLPWQFLKFDRCAGNHAVTTAHVALLRNPTARKMRLPIYGLPSVRQVVSAGCGTAKHVAATVGREVFVEGPPCPSSIARFCDMLWVWLSWLAARRRSCTRG